MWLLGRLYPVLSCDYINIENAAGRERRGRGRGEGRRAPKHTPPVPREAACRTSFIKLPLGASACVQTPVLFQL